MNFIIDVMGGDHAPYAPVLGAANAVKEVKGFTVTLVGNESAIRKILWDKGIKDERIIIVHAESTITNDEAPTKAIKKKDSSMVKAFEMMKNNNQSVLVSAGSTGALMAGALFLLGRIPGIDRPALPFYLPTDHGPILILDGGANTVCKPDNYLQFGIMGSIYMKDVFGISNPKVGLINVGSEEGKGNETIKQAYSLLSQSDINFKGNIEGREIPEGKVDVAVCDGFVGNILLKFAEGIAGFFFDNMKQVFKKNILNKISALVIKKDLKNFKKKVDYTEYGGVPLLGVEGKVIKCHGSSNEKAIKNAILKAIRYAQSDVISEIRERMRTLEVENNG